MYRFIKPVLVYLICFFYTLSALSNQGKTQQKKLEIGEFTPLIAVGYKPEKSTDEAGLWMAMDKYESELKYSDLLFEDEALNQYMQSILCRLSSEYCEGIRIYIVNNPHFNASMAPNGVMTIWSGLLIRLENEAQLASVIGHELAHYLLTHSIDSWRAAKRGSAIAAFLSGALGGVGDLISLGIAGSFFSYGRFHEYEADLYGLQLMSQAGYDVNQSFEVWETVIEEDERTMAKRKRNPFTASHPKSKDRIKKLKEKIENLNIANDQSDIGTEKYQSIIGPHYMTMMDQMIKTRQYDRIDYLLERHKTSSLPRGDYFYFKGEYIRHRYKTGDELVKAVDAYKASIGHSGPPEAHRNLGYTLVKLKQSEKAKAHFEKYLELKPAADDKAMVQFYLN